MDLIVQNAQKKKCLTCPNGEYLETSSETCKSCADKFPDCTSCDESKCLSCKDGYVLENPTSSNPCTNFECGGDDFIQIGNLCITKKNMGDGDKLTIPSAVNVVNAGTSCSPSSSNYCCWQGKISSVCDNANGGGYSGCGRTVCDWYAADYICKNFNAGGYTWRLPTISEMSNWAVNSIGVGTNGLQLCDHSQDNSSASCNYTYSCTGSLNSWCSSSRLHSSDLYPYSSTQSYSYYLTGGSWLYDNYDFSATASTRCVAQMPQSCSDKYGEGCATCTDSKCLSCESGYKLSSNASSSNACEKPFTCSGTDFMQIGSLCVTRRNMGDSTALTIPSGVNVVSAGSSCSPSASNFCCWQGKTAAMCDNANGGGYSGCNRTVCDWWAADYICKNFKAGGYTWRLATESEMSKWGNNSIGKGVNGLQLCDEWADYSSAMCESIENCVGSSLGCKPYFSWVSKTFTSSYAYNYSLSFGRWNSSTTDRTNASSVRCVTKL